MKSSAWARLLVALSFVAAAAAPAATTLRVADFGAVGDGKTDDGPALMRAFQAATNAGDGAVVEFEPRVYRVGPTRGRWCALHLTDADNIVLDGRGATLLFHPKNRGLRILRCRDIVVRGFKVDYDPLPFTQGDVVAVHGDRGAFDLRIHDGYADPPGQEWIDKNRARHRGWRQGVFIEPDSRRFTHNWVYVETVQPLPGAPRTFRVTAKDIHARKLATVEPGQRFVLQTPHADSEWIKQADVIGQGENDLGIRHTIVSGSIQIRRSTNVTLEDVDHYISPSITVRCTGSDNVVFRRLRITPKPGTDRLTSGLSDGTHCKGARVGPTWEDCLFEATCDDSMNSSTHADLIMEIFDERTFHTRYTDIVYYDSCLNEGDDVIVWDSEKGVVMGEARVVGLEFIRNQQRRVTLDRPFPDARSQKDVGKDAATRLYVKKVSPTVVRGCEFRSQLKTAILVRDPCVIEDNYFIDSAYGVHFHNSPRWDAGPPPSTAVIRRNRFESVSIGAIIMLALSGTPDMVPVGDEFLIEDNVMRDIDGHGLRVNNLRNLRVVGNDMRIDPATAPGRAAVHIQNCAAVAIDDLTVRDDRPGEPAAIVAIDTPRDQLRLGRVEADLADGVETVVFKP